MAAAVVSGSVALLLEQRRNLDPRETKAVIQITSSRVADEGLVATGAGSLNVLAATELVNSRMASASTRIGGERVRRTGIAFEILDRDRDERSQRTFLRSLASNRVAGIVWNTDASDTIIWSTGDTIIWSASDELNTLIWSTCTENGTIIWSTSTIDTIIWSTHTQSDTIIWSTSDTIIWSTARLKDTIIWSTFIDGSLQLVESNAF
jgi:hypothetical protein